MILFNSRAHAAATVVALSLAIVGSSAQAQDVQRTELSPGHPLIGAWRIDVPGKQCHEIYDIHQNGTMSVTSGAQIGGSEFEMSARPSARGFYKWVDKIVTDNGKPDCSGEIMKIGDVATNFIFLHPSGRQFLMCEAEDIGSCIGPFVRQENI